MKCLIKLQLTILLLIAALACSNDKPGILHGLNESTIDFSYIDTTYRSFLRLETTPESLISEIGEVLFDTGFVFVYDKRSCSVFVFDSIGQYISKVDSKGRGPGEYTEGIKTFDLDRQRNEIILYDPGPRKLLRFSYDGSFKKEIYLPQYYGLTFAYLGEDKYAFWLHNYDDYQIIVTDGKGEVVDRHHPRKTFYKDLNITIIPYFSKNCNNSPYYIPIWEDKIYRITHRGVKEVFDFGFSDEMVSREQDVKARIQKQPYEKYNYFNDLVVSGTGGFFVRTSYGNTAMAGFPETPSIAVLRVVGDMREGVLSSGKVIVDGSVLGKVGFAFSYPTGTKGADFFTALSPAVINSIYGSVFPDVDNDGNPVLLFFRIKEY